MVDVAKIREAVRGELTARYAGCVVPVGAIEDAIVAAFKVAFDVAPDKPPAHEQVRPCPVPFLVGGDEYLCDRCKMRWGLDEDKPQCPRSDST